MAYACGGLGMCGQGIVTHIDLVMRLVRVSLGYETSSLDASHSKYSTTDFHRFWDLAASINMTCQSLSITLLMILLVLLSRNYTLQSLLGRNHILHPLFSRNKIPHHHHFKHINILTILIKGINPCIKILFGMVETILTYQ